MEYNYQGLTVTDIRNIQKIRFPKVEPFEIDIERVSIPEINDTLIDQITNRIIREVNHDTEMSIICELAIMWLQEHKKEDPAE